MLRRIGVLALGAVLLIVMVVGGALAWVTFFPNTLKPLVERYASTQIGREVRIDGPLDIEPGLVTVVDLRGLRIAAPDWAMTDDLLSVAHLRVAADLGAYLRRRAVRLPELTVEQPVLALERDAQGRTSWPSSGGSPTRASGPPPHLELGRVTIAGGKVAYVDAPAAVDVQAEIETDSGTQHSLGIAANASGTIQAKPLEVVLRIANVREAAEQAGPADVEGSASLAGTELGLKGQIREPAAMSGLDLALNLQVDRPAETLALLGPAPAAPLPPLAASAAFTGDGRVYAAEEIKVRWGQSDLDGHLRLDLSQPRPTLDGALQSKLLDLTVFQPAASGDENRQAPASWANPLRPLADYAGRLAIQADEIRLPRQLVLRDSAITLSLSDGRLTAAPLEIGLPEGTIAGEIATGPLGAEQLTVEPKLKATGVDVAALAGKGYGGKVDADLAGSILVADPKTSIARSRVKVSGSATDLVIPRARLGSISATAQVENGRVRVEPLEAELPEGQVRGQLLAGPFDQDFQADLDLDMSAVDLAAIARVEGVAGRLDGKLSGTVRGSQPLDVLTRSTLQLKGTVSDLQLPRVERRIGRAEIDASLDPDRREALKIVARAAAGDRTLNLTAFGGSSSTLAEYRGDYPFTVVSELGKNEIKVNGTVSLPLTERRFAATIEAKGPDPSPILALFDLPKLQIPPYRLAGVFTNHGDELQIKDFDGKVGDSDLTANLVIDTSGERPKIAGDAHSRVLDADDLGGLVGAAPSTGPGETASPGQRAEARHDKAKPTVLPDERIDPARWRRVDLDLRVAADHIRAGKVPLDGFSGHVTMDDGLLRISDMDLTVGGGHLTGSIEADGRREPVVGQVDLDLRRASVARLLNRLDVDVAAFGTLSGQAQGGVGLGGSGRSIKEILGRSDGQVRLQMEGGRIDRTIVAALGLDLLRLLGAATGASPDTVEMHCALANLDVKDGLVTTDPLVIDTEIAEIGGRGTVDLKTETIDLSLTARPKETPLLTDLTGISVGGKLGKPEIQINPVVVAARGVAAATLGLVLKPFTSLAGAAEDEEPSPCADLIARSPG
ncbi:MAG: AsmA family protein [Geminicoccaceae bacterium]